VLARVIEEAGLSTTAIVLIKEHAMRVKPPRALLVPFPFGFALGNPEDPPFQHKVLAAALDLMKVESTPVLAEFPEDGQAPARFLQASAARAGLTTLVDIDPVDEMTALRGYYERQMNDQGGRTMVGLIDVPQRRWRGLVKYMQAFVEGRVARYEDLPADLSTARFLRLASDDLKAFYFEARMCQSPGLRNNELQKWFWTRTAAGNLLAEVAERLNASGDEADAQGALGIAR